MRLILAILGSVAGLILLVFVVLLLLPAERLAQIAIDRLTAEMGHEITIEGAARPILWPDLMISVQDLQVNNPDWAGTRPLLRADEAVLNFGWRALFGGEGGIDRLELYGATLTLVRDADARMSWRNGESSLLPLARGQAQLRDSSIRYIDQASGVTMDLRQVSAVVDLHEGENGSAAFVVSGLSNGEVMELSGTVARAGRFFEGDPQPLRLDLLWREGSLRFTGHAAMGEGAEGTLDFRSIDLAPVVRLMGQEVPDVVTELAGVEFAVDGEMTLAEGGSLHLRDGVVELGDTRLNAALDLVPGEQRPLLRGTITGGRIALSDGPDYDVVTPEGTWSREPFDVSGLFAVDADLTVLAEALSLGAMELEGPDLRISLDRGRLVFDIAHVGLAEGQLAGEFVVNGRGGLSVGGDLLLANTETGSLHEAFPGFPQVTGRGSASIEFLGVGDDLYSILEGLEAEGDLSLRLGRFEGIDFPGVARNDEPLGSLTEFDAIQGDFRVRAGTLIGEDLLLEGPWGALIGAGTIDLAQREVDYRLVPDRWTEAREVPVPVLLSGSWDALEVRPDPDALEALANAAAAERARAAEVARILGGGLVIGDPNDAEPPDARPAGNVETEE